MLHPLFQAPQAGRTRQKRHIGNRQRQNIGPFPISPLFTSSTGAIDYFIKIKFHFSKILAKSSPSRKRDVCADPDQAQFRRPAEAASNPAALLDIRTAAKYSLPVYSSLSIEKWGPPTFFFPHIQR